MRPQNNALTYENHVKSTSKQLSLWHDTHSNTGLAWATDTLLLTMGITLLMQPVMYTGKTVRGTHRPQNSWTVRAVLGQLCQHWSLIGKSAAGKSGLCTLKPSKSMNPFSDSEVVLGKKIHSDNCSFYKYRW